jgi:hypothetical protein
MKSFIGRRGWSNRKILEMLFGIHEESFQNLLKTLLAIEDGVRLDIS